MFTFNYAVTGINRTLINTPRQIFEYGTEIIDETGKPGIYFSKTKVKEKYEEYLDDNIYRYVNNYHVDYLYYNPSKEANTCDVYDCTAVRIIVTARIEPFSNYKNEMHYEIRRVH